MKNFIQNIILFLITIAIALLSGYFIYQSYLSYKGYKIAQNADVYIPHINDIDQVLKKVEQECALSSFYLAANGKIDFKQMQVSRDETDEAIKNTNKFTQNHPKFLTNLQYVRSRVDVVSSDYKDIIFSYYQDELSNTLLKEIQDEIQELSLGLNNLKKELHKYNDIISSRNDLSKEKSFITYILTASKKMDNEDMELWDQLLDNRNFSKSDFKTRVKIARGITTGNYQIDIKTWLETSNQNIVKEIDSEEKIYTYLLSKIKNQKSYPKTLIYNAAIALFLLLTFFFLLRSQKAKPKKRKLNRDIVKKVEIPTKNITNKNRATDKPNAEIVPNIEIPKTGKRATDIPLTNSEQEKVYQTYDEDSQSNIRSFNPMEEFAHIINHFVEKTAKKDIGFKYKIDPTIPIYCIGDIDKIHEALHYLLKYAIQSSNSKNFLTLNIESIAQTKIETAIRFSLNQSNTSITNEEIKEIHNAKHDDFYYKAIKSSKLNKAKLNLLKVSQLISKTDGRLQIKRDTKNTTDFQITVNLKRE